MSKFWPILATLLLLATCDSKTPSADQEAGAAAGAGKGTLAMVEGTCGACHQVPDPNDLSRGIWDTIVFPRMGQFLGRYSSLNEREKLLGENPSIRTALEAANVYPQEALISDDDWMALRAYYLDLAPATAPAAAFVPGKQTSLFTPRFPGVFLSPPSTSFVRFSSDGILAADINKSTLLGFDRQLTPQGQLPVGRGLTDMAGNYATVIGNFSPTEEGTGQLLQHTSSGYQVVGRGLQRPTSLAVLDTDRDGTEEVIVSEFGKWTGRVSLWRQTGNNTMTSSSLADRSGAIQVVVDTTKSTPTAYVLFGQGKEAIVRYSFPDGKPVTETVLEFPPSYGSSSLQLIDWNQDEFPDLLYTNGDNADYRSPVKAYHGIRVFTGAADGSFKEALFIPFPGAYGASLADFNLDGKLDLAGISFFPDYTQVTPVAAAIFLQETDGSFTNYPLPANDRGRFLVLDAADYDQDGDIDLLAGSLAMEAVPDKGQLQGWVKQGLPFILWENQVK